MATVNNRQIHVKSILFKFSKCVLRLHIQMNCNGIAWRISPTIRGKRSPNSWDTPSPLSVGVSSWSLSHPESPGALHCHLTHPSIKLRICSMKMKFILQPFVETSKWKMKMKSSSCLQSFVSPPSWFWTRLHWQEKLTAGASLECPGMLIPR